MAYLGLLKRKNCLVLTGWGWTIIVLAVIGGLTLGIRNIHRFLSLNRPIESRILVVEGWLPDYALKSTIEEFNEHHYDLIITTGGPLERGFYLSYYKTNAEIAAATLRELGLPEERIVAVPASTVRKDRTYAAALALRQWLATSELSLTSFNICTLGAHARRSWLLYDKVLGRDVSVGVIALNNINYDPLGWWKSSKGVRTVIGEMVAYVYARFFFQPRA